MKTKKSKINEFLATLDESNELSEKLYVSLVGTGLPLEVDQTDKNLNNSRCCNDRL